MEPSALQSRMNAAVGGLAASATILLYSCSPTAGQYALTSPLTAATLCPEADDSSALSANLIATMRDEQGGVLFAKMGRNRSASRSKSSKSKRNSVPRNKTVTAQMLVKHRNPTSVLVRRLPNDEKVVFYSRMYNKSKVTKSFMIVLNKVFKTTGLAKPSKSQKQFVLNKALFSAKDSNKLVDKAFELYRKGTKRSARKGKSKRSKRSRRSSRKTRRTGAHPWANCDMLKSSPNSALYKRITAFLTSKGWGPLHAAPSATTPPPAAGAAVAGAPTTPAAAVGGPAVTPATSGVPVPASTATPVAATGVSTATTAAPPAAVSTGPATTTPAGAKPRPTVAGKPKAKSVPGAKEPPTTPEDHVGSHEDFKIVSPKGVQYSKEDYSHYSKNKDAVLQKKVHGFELTGDKVQTQDKALGFHTYNGTADDVLKLVTDKGAWVKISVSKDFEEDKKECNLQASDACGMMTKEGNGVIYFQGKVDQTTVGALNKSGIYEVFNKLSDGRNFTGIVYDEMANTLFPKFNGYYAYHAHSNLKERPCVVYCSTKDGNRELAAKTFMMPVVEAPKSTPSA